MPNIKPISDLRNYNEVLKDCSMDSPVYLTKNGRGCYVIMDITDYEKQKNLLNLYAKLAAGEKQIENGQTMTLEEAKLRLKEKYDK